MRRIGDAVRTVPTHTHQFGTGVQLLPVGITPADLVGPGREEWSSQGRVDKHEALVSCRQRSVRGEDFMKAAQVETLVLPLNDLYVGQPSYFGQVNCMRTVEHENEVRLSMQSVFPEECEIAEAVIRLMI